MFRKIFFLLTLIVLFIPIMAVEAQSPLPISDEEKKWMENHPIIRLGVGVAFPPYMWVEKEEGQHIFKGMVSDYVNLIKKRLGLEMQIVFDIPFNQALAQGKKRQIDFFPCLAKTPGRSNFLLFTEPYFSYPMVIITREDAPIIGGIQDLKRKRFALVKHLVVYSKIQAEHSNLDFDYVFTKTVDQNLEAVSIGQADACIVSLASAGYFIQKKGLANLKVAAPVNLDPVRLSMGIRKDWPVFQGIIEKVLASISQEEKDRISQKWIRVKYEPGVDMDLVWRWSLGLGLGIIIIFALVLVWNQRLQTEISKTKTAENAHKESERKLSTLIGNLPGIVYRCLNDKNWTMLYLSDGCETLTGYNPTEIISNNLVSFNDLVVPEDRQYVGKEIQTAMDENRPFTLEYRICDKNGNLKWVWEKGIKLQKDNNGPLILEGFITDITERKLAEKAHKKVHKTFLTVLDSIDATVFVVDMETYEILFVNKHMVKNLGKNMKGKICWEEYGNEPGPCLYCPRDQILNKDGTPGGVHIWQKQNPITQKWYLNYDRAIEWTDGRLVKLQIATDITEFKKMESELRQSHKMESIGTLAGGIAHDFNNILSIILGNTELALSDTPGQSPARESIQEIKTASLRAKDVVKQLLSFSRKTEQNQKPQNLAPLVKESVKLLRSSIPSSIQIIEKIIEPTHPVFANATQIHQVIINLCTNAAHAMSGKSGRLEIRLHNLTLEKKEDGKYKNLVPGDYLELMVNDTGKGISPQIFNKIFDPYFTTKEFGKGTGMGLAVVHGIIKNHNGSIHVDSRVGKGSSFSIFFPALEGQDKKQKAAPSESLAKGTERILFVDDEKSIVDLSLKILQKLGYHVEGKTCPLKAVAKFKDDPNYFDLVITDMTMPKLDGLELSKELKSIQPDLPIIMCTGNSSILDGKTTKELGISAVVMKPVAMAKIAGIIRNVLSEPANKNI